MLETRGNRFEYEMNVLLRTTRNIKIEKVPIETIYINNNSKTHFKPVKDAYMIYKNIIKFSMSSIISFIIDYTLYTILVNLFSTINTTLKLILANVIARIISASVNYILNKKYVFEDSKKHNQTAWKYILLAITILALNTGIMLGLEVIGLNNLYILKLITEIILFGLSFVVQKFIIFKRKDLHEIF